MKKIFFTPGPSELYPTVKKHIQNCLKDDILSISHRGSQFGKIYSQTETGLKNLLSIPKDYFIFFLSSGTEAMERIIENCAEEKSFHFISGAFGDKFYEIASLLGKNPQKYAIDVNKIFLKKGFILNNFPELICFTQNETSNGWSFPLNIIYDFKNKNPSSIVAVDIVSSVPCINMDFSLIDIAFFSVQKGFGLPAGLAVLVVGPQAYEKALKLERKAKTIGSYHSFLTLRNYVKKNQTPETPNILAIYLLGKVTQDMQKIGIKKIRNNTQQKAAKIYEVLEQCKTLKPYIRLKNYRSQTVIVAQGKNIDRIHTALSNLNIIAGKGYGKDKDCTIRIANFPAHSEADIDRLIYGLNKLIE